MIWCRWVVVVLIAAFCAAGGVVRAAEAFAIRDGDTVVFLGDSITAERSYGKMIENYTLLRFPNYKVRFVNAGIGGDTAAGGLKRLQRDVFDRGATVLTVAFGINDIGWGTKADDEHRKLYLDSIREIVRQCKQRGVRVYVCSAAATGADPDKAEGDFLQKMCEEGMRIAREEGGESIDVLGTMRQVQRRIKEANAGETDPKKHETLHAADGIHLNELGATAMGYAILKGLHAPAEVSSASVDAGTGAVAEARGCAVDGVKKGEDGVEFDRLDEGLPLNQGLFWVLRSRFIPFPDELNRYMLTVKGLKEGKYAITVDGRGLGTFASEQLAAGVNLAHATADGWQPGGPWEAQAWMLNLLTDSRNSLAQSEKSVGEYRVRVPDAGGAIKATDRINEEIEGLQRQMARPMKYHFVVKRGG